MCVGCVSEEIVHSVNFILKSVLMQFGFCLIYGSSFHPLCLPVAAGGEARSADQAALEAWSGGHQPGPAGRPGVAQILLHERDHCKPTLKSLSR